jgi:Fe-S cluster assembly protein SufD
MGVRLLSLKSALEEYEDQLAPIFQGSLLAADNRFAAWHASAWSHGVFLSVPPFVETEDLFVIEFIESGNWMLTSPRVVVFLGDGSRATVMQRTRSSRDEEELLCNSGLELKAGDGAALRYVEGQALGKRSLHFRHSRAELGRDASLRHLDVTIGGRLVKTRFDCGLNGAGAEAFLDGAYFCGQGQHMDLRTVQRHRAPSAMSRATYKGAIDSGGRTVFQGLIEVSEGASGTDAYLSNRNLILGDAARADSIPTLQIGNNDVRCSHGSTTGQLREEEIFYLVSRGLSPRDARELLVIGYFEEILNAAPPSFSEDALAAIRARLLQ